MKQVLYIILIASLFGNCKRNDKIPELARVPLPLITADVVNGDKVIPPLDPDAFHGVFTVDMYFKDDIKPKKADVVIIKNGNKGNAKVIMADVTSFPTTVTITGTQLATLFGEALVSGDQFDIGANITTQSGQLYEAFPVDGEGYGANITNLAGANPILNYLMPCPFVASMYDGNFTVVSDDWNDYAAGTVIPVTVESANQISFKYAADDALPIVLTVNTADNSITAPKQGYGNYGGLDFFAEGVPGNASFVNPCDTSLSVKLSHTDIDGGAYGSYTIKLKVKNP